MTDKEREIEIIEQGLHCNPTICRNNGDCYKCTATRLYRAGYRKADEVRKEVFNKILSCIKEKRNSLTYTTQDSKIHGQCVAYSDMEIILRELAKEYGVEVE